MKSVKAPLFDRVMTLPLELPTEFSGCLGVQVMGLQQRGIHAEYMGSAQTDKSVNNRAENGEFDVLYMTPEKACSVSQRSA